MRFKFKVNLFNEDKPKPQAGNQNKGTGKRSDLKRFPKGLVNTKIGLQKNFKKNPSKNHEPEHEERETRDPDQRGRYEEREPCEGIRRDATPPIRAYGVVAPRVGSRRDFQAIRKNPKQPKQIVQQKLSKKVDARLDALREQLGVEFDHEYGAQMHRVQSIEPQQAGRDSMNFDRTRSVPGKNNTKTANMQTACQVPFAGKAAPAPLPTQRLSSFNGQRQPLVGGNHVSSFAPYSRPPSKMLARAQMDPIVHKKPTQPPKSRFPQQVKSRSKKLTREAAPRASRYGILGALFSGMCTADSACANAQSGCNHVRSGCSDMQTGCTSAKKCADGTMFDEETLWTKSETLSETQYDGETMCSRTKSYVGEHESDVSDSDFDDESSWDDATSYQSEEDTHYHSGRRTRASGKTQERKQADRPSSRNTRPEKRGNKSLRACDDETYGYSDGESFDSENKTEVDTYCHTEYDTDSQWTDGETYFTKETRRTRRRRDSDSDFTDSDLDSRSCSSYDSEDSYDKRTYGDSTWKTNCRDDETFYTRQQSRGYDDDTIYTEVKKRPKPMKRR
ncbi:unnamed protein product [Cylindrotheca closterium]|uniref:Uncharacterized protein n=1 Tax=Cylindrotheca closterium TaxID=2856 RepID=A0AAD2CK70_9STRA|nr:unnamed protein product [Cylindrotheca closterium]